MPTNFLNNSSIICISFQKWNRGCMNTVINHSLQSFKWWYCNMFLDSRPIQLKIFTDVCSPVTVTQCFAHAQRPLAPLTLPLLIRSLHFWLMNHLVWNMLMLLWFTCCLLGILEEDQVLLKLCIHIIPITIGDTTVVVWCLPIIIFTLCCFNMF